MSCYCVSRPHLFAKYVKTAAKKENKSAFPKRCRYYSPSGNTRFVEERVRRVRIPLIYQLVSNVARDASSKTRVIRKYRAAQPGRIIFSGRTRRSNSSAV